MPSKRVPRAPECPDLPAELPPVLDLIQGWKWFAHIPEPGRAWLAERALVRRFARGERIYSSGETATHIYGVASGAFRIYLTSPRGDEITLEEVVPGGWFPHLVQQARPSYLGSCVCLRDAAAYAVPVRALAEFQRRWPGWFQGLYEEFTDRAVIIFGRIELLTLHTLDVRLAVYLLRMARLRGEPAADGSLAVPIGESQSEIGARVGGTRQLVNGVLKRWARRGVMAIEKSRIRIFDVAALSAEATKSGFELDAYLQAWHGGWQGRDRAARTDG